MKSKYCLVVLTLIIFCTGCSSQIEIKQPDSQTVFEQPINDVLPLGYRNYYHLQELGTTNVDDYTVTAEDFQKPELPTGCEATAAATLLRMNSVDVSKTQFAKRMPKSDGEDFVNKFWGDPFSSYGWAIMSPGIVTTIEFFLPLEKTVINITGNNLVWLPTPCLVWVTIGISDPIKSKYSQDGYSLLENTHCVVLTYVDESQVKVIDPLEGEKTYPFSKFDKAYIGNGRQSIYIADRGYHPYNE